MKTRMIVALIVAICTLSSVAAEAQRINMDALRRENGIESVYLSKSMLKNSSKYLKRKTDLSINNSMLNGMHIFSADRQQTAAANLLRRTFSPMLQGAWGNYDELMFVRKTEEQMALFAERSKKDLYKSLILYTEDVREVRAVIFEGEFTRDQLDQMINSGGRLYSLPHNGRSLKLYNWQGPNGSQLHKGQLNTEWDRARQQFDRNFGAYRKELELARKEMDKLRGAGRNQLAKDYQKWIKEYQQHIAQFRKEWDRVRQQFEKDSKKYEKELERARKEMNDASGIDRKLMTRDYQAFLKEYQQNLAELNKEWNQVRRKFEQANKEYRKELKEVHRKNASLFK